MWASKEFDEWVKKQVEAFKKQGIRTSTAGVTKILVKRVIHPNNISLVPKMKPIKGVKVRIKLKRLKI